MIKPIKIIKKIICTAGYGASISESKRGIKGTKTIGAATMVDSQSLKM
jgi:hypothetical protein